MLRQENKTWTKEIELNQQWLKDCLTEMSKQDIIFRSEEQFQFNLAWAIQEFFYTYKVYLEELTSTIDYNNSEKKRSYTDILVKKDNGDYIALELKYKTVNATIGNIELLNHGAVDNGRYDYLWDINRLEWLVYGESKRKQENGLINQANNCRTNPLPNISHYNYDNRIKGEKITGYTIMLTNEFKYWTFSKQTSPKKNLCKNCGNVHYHDFCIAEADETGKNNTNGKGKIQDWMKGAGNYKKSVCDIWRGRPIEFIGNYVFRWETYKNYNNIENGIFKYCIVEVKQ